MSKKLFKLNYNFLNELYHKIVCHQLEQMQQIPMQELSVLMQMLHFLQNGDCSINSTKSNLV